MFFTYTAIDKDNKEIKGRVDASNRTSAITVLLNKGYTVVSLKEADDTKAFSGIFLRVRTKDMVIFSRQIATLFEAEVSALRAFNLIAENVQNKYFQGILRDIAKHIEQGFSIERAFMQHKDIFGEFFISVISVGERSGTLPESFLYLADYVERNAEITARIKKALTYPVFVILIFIAVMVLMLVTVIPQIATILTDSGAELPFVTKMVIGASEFFKANIAIILIAFAAFVAGGIYWARTKDGKRALDETVVTLPMLGALFRNFYIVRFSRNIGVMLTSGVPIVSALQTISRVMGNAVYTDIVLDVTKKMQEGTTLSVALENQPLISKNIAQIIRIGEETGKLPQMFEVITDFYEKQLQNTIDTALDLIQPTIIVALGASVGLLIGSVIIPIYSVTSSL